jgi:hypothetical protein
VSEDRAFVERRVRETQHELNATVSDAEIQLLVDAVMLQQQAEDAAAAWIGYHEHVCGSGEKESHYVDGWLAGWAACLEFTNLSITTNTVLGGMEKQRDPRMDPQVGDKIYRITPSTGLRRSRQVVARVNNDISYLTHDGKQKKCWIGTWMEWAVHAEVEPPGVLGVSPKEVQTLNAGIDDLAKKVAHERRKG